MDGGGERGVEGGDVAKFATVPGDYVLVIAESRESNQQGLSPLKRFLGGVVIV